MTRRKFAAGAALMWSIATPALAQDVSVTIDDQGAANAGLDPSMLEKSMSDAISNTLHLGDYGPFMEQMANASVAATKGMGVDYATNPQKVVFGYSFGTAINGAGAGFTRGGAVPEGGFALQMAAMAGINLGIAAEDGTFFRRIVIYVNGMKGATSVDPFRGELMNVGAHAQIKLVKSRDSKAVEWGGLDVTSGYEYGAYTLKLEQALPIDADSMVWDATGTFQVESTAASIPIEVSTNLRFLVFSAFAGGALDVNLGSQATSSISLAGPLTTDALGQELTIGSASVTKVDTGYGNDYQPRVFGGAQVNIFPFKLYGQLNVGFDQDFQDISFGGHVGARLAL